MIDYTDFEEYRMKTLDATFKGGLLSSLDEVIAINQITYRNYSFRILDEFLFLGQQSWMFPKHSYLEKPISRCINQLHSNGLISKWTTTYMDSKYLRIEEPTLGLRKINMNQLLGGFELLLAGLLLSTITFYFEHLYRTLK